MEIGKKHQARVKTEGPKPEAKVANGGHVENGRHVENGGQAPDLLPVDVHGGPSKQVRAVLGDAPSLTHAPSKKQSAAGVAARTGFGHFAKAITDVVSVATKSVFVGLVALTVSSLWNPTMADTVFFDHNDAPMEIAVAKKLAQSINEKFILVRPDSASLDAVFAKAERGEIDIRHLILSGHSTGHSVWGTGADGERRQTSMDDLKKLKLKYPAAFAQVEHVHFMACYAGSAGNSADWSVVFPNAKAIAGFWGSGPAKTQPAAMKMLESSERHLRTLDDKKLSPQQAMIEAKRMANMPGSNVTKFAIRLDGVHFALGEKVEAHAVLADRVRLLEARAYEPWMSPINQAPEFANTPTNHQASPLRDYYNALQAYRNVLEPGSSDATSASARIDTTIRLIYFDVIAKKMQTHHGAELDAARADLAKLGFTLPDITKATRLEIVQAAKELDAMKTPQLRGFMTRNAADLEIVNVANGGALSSIDETDYQYAIDQMKSRLTALASAEGASVELKGAVERLTAQLDAPAPPSIEKAKELFVKGLRNLDPSVVPSTWIE
jgi:hypothetical protein